MKWEEVKFVPPETGQAMMLKRGKGPKGTNLAEESPVVHDSVPLSHNKVCIVFPIWIGVIITNIWKVFTPNANALQRFWKRRDCLAI
jgi:hypothetical protein